jgi:hypothetical protein
MICVRSNNIVETICAIGMGNKSSGFIQIIDIDECISWEMKNDIIIWEMKNKKITLPKYNVKMNDKKYFKIKQLVDTCFN